MQYLLDTHVFLWFINGDEQLSKKVRAIISDINADKFISIASLWEIAIKVNINKLGLSMPFAELQQQIITTGIAILPISFAHTNTLSTLEVHHKDPFDRIIIAQALTERLTLISKDKHFSSYKQLQLVW